MVKVEVEVVPFGRVCTKQHNRVLKKDPRRPSKATKEEEEGKKKKKKKEKKKKVGFYLVQVLPACTSQRLRYPMVHGCGIVRPLTSTNGSPAIAYKYRPESVLRSMMLLSLMSI